MSKVHLEDIHICVTKHSKKLEEITEKSPFRYPCPLGSSIAVKALLPILIFLNS